MNGKTPEIIDRVAKAMCRTSFSNDHEWDKLNDAQRLHFRVMAQSAIVAMREPPKGLEKIVYHGDYGDDVWREMIDAALQ